MAQNELYHHGVKGQKWGVRRYQNADGSLTSAGKRRALSMQNKYTEFSNDKKYRDKDGNLTYAGRKKALRMKEKYSELTGGKQLRKFQDVGTKQTTNQKVDYKSKKIKDMSDDELRERINRLNLEKEYNETLKKTNSYSRGKRFIDKFKDSTVDKIADNVAADLVAQALKVAGAKGANELLKKVGLQPDVHTNNKKKN